MSIAMDEWNLICPGARLVVAATYGAGTLRLFHLGFRGGPSIRTWPTSMATVTWISSTCRQNRTGARNSLSSARRTGRLRDRDHHSFSLGAKSISRSPGNQPQNSEHRTIDVDGDGRDDLVGSVGGMNRILYSTGSGVCARRSDTRRPGSDPCERRARVPIFSGSSPPRPVHQQVPRHERRRAECAGNHCACRGSLVQDRRLER